MHDVPVERSRALVHEERRQRGTRTAGLTRRRQNRGGHHHCHQEEQGGRSLHRSEDDYKMKSSGWGS